jgi:hypothetical protein
MTATAPPNPALSRSQASPSSACATAGTTGSTIRPCSLGAGPVPCASRVSFATTIRTRRVQHTPPPWGWPRVCRTATACPGSPTPAHRRSKRCAWSARPTRTAQAKGRFHSVSRWPYRQPSPQGLASATAPGDTRGSITRRARRARPPRSVTAASRRSARKERSARRWPGAGTIAPALRGGGALQVAYPCLPAGRVLLLTRVGRRGALQAVPGRQVQPATRVYSVRRPDGCGLYHVCSRHGVERDGAEHDVRRVQGGNCLVHHRGDVRRVPKRDVCAGAGEQLYKLPAGVVGVPRLERLHGMSERHVPRCGRQRRGRGVSLVPSGDCIVKAGELGSGLQCVPPWHVPAERGMHWLCSWDVFQHESDRMLYLPARDVFRTQCHVVHRLSCWGLQCQEWEFGVCSVRPRVLQRVSQVHGVSGVLFWHYFQCERVGWV